jgi:LysM repeat protein
MKTPRCWKIPLPLPRRLAGALAVVTCLCVGAVQAADTGPRHHARGKYDAATATYVVATGDDLDAIAERFEIPVAELPRENQLTSTVIDVSQKLALAGAAPATAPTYMPDIPAKITTPETVEARIGTLHFPNGVPGAQTAEKVYDQLDFGRGVDAFLRGMSAASVQGLCSGFEDAGIETNKGLGITADLMNAWQLFLTANTTTVYVTQCVNLSDGPMVVRVPPKILGLVDDADFRWVTDLGFTSPDKGAGGDFLFIPPGYDGEVPSEGYYVQKPRTNRLFLFYRAFVEKGDIAAVVEYVKAKAGVSPSPRRPRRRRRSS